MLKFSEYPYQPIDIEKISKDLSSYISEFKNAKNAEEIVKIVPMNRMLIETDSPYLAPEPKRGSRNDSRNVRLVAQKIADFKGISLEEVAEQSYRNALTIFGKISQK